VLQAAGTVDIRTYLNSSERLVVQTNVPDETETYSSHSLNAQIKPNVYGLSTMRSFILYHKKC